MITSEEPEDTVWEDRSGTIEAVRSLAETLKELAFEAENRNDAGEASRLIDSAIWYKKYAERLENGYEE